MSYKEYTRFGISDVAPLSRQELEINTFVQYPNPAFPMATLLPNGVPTPGFTTDHPPGSWTLINLTNNPAYDPMPHDIGVVEVCGQLDITMGLLNESVDIRLWLAAPSSIAANNSYCGQVVCVSSSQGQRSPNFFVVPAENGCIAAAWWFGNGLTPAIFDPPGTQPPQHATAGIVMRFPGYRR